MAELARGSVADRPWGRTLATLGLRGVTGQLCLVAEGKRFLVAFDRGAVVAAASPLAADAAVRVALTSHLVSSSQVPEIARHQAAWPDRDEIELIAELARLGPDHALRLRRRVIAQRAARTFSIQHGEFIVTDEIELAVLAGCELDIRAIVYLGARANLAEQRLDAELAKLGAWFRLRPGLEDDLPQFGFGDAEQLVLERLRDGGTLAEIDAFATSFVDARTVHAVVYALAACSACEIDPGAGQPQRSGQGRAPAAAPPAPPGQATRPATPASPVPPAVPRGRTTAGVSTGSPPPRPTSPLATGSTALRPAEHGLDAPPSPGRGPGISDHAAREPSQPRARTSSEARMRDGGRSESSGWSESSGSIRLPSEEALRAGGAGSAARRPLDRAEAGPGLVVRPVRAARPTAARQLARVDSPQSHQVKAVIAQRLKLLDQGADHFQLLGVAQDVLPDALRKAYFALARQLHPDRLAALGISDDGKHAQRLFAEINAGFAILSDPGRRAGYVDVLRRGGEAAIRAEQARAEALARQIVEAEEAFRRGELALRRDQPDDAVVELERAVQLSPDEADYHAALAWARFCAAPDKPGVAPATRSALERAIQRAPRSVSPRFYLGRVERMLGRDAEALRHFRAVLADAPGHTEAASEVRALEARLSSGDRDRPGGVFGRFKR